MAESSKRRKTTVSRPNFNTEKFQSKEKSNLYRDFYVSMKVHLERNVHPSVFESIPIGSLFDALRGDQVVGALIQQNELLSRFHRLNIIVCANIHVTSHSSHITQDQGYVLYCIDHRLPIDLSKMIVSKMISVFEDCKSLGLPYGCFVTRFLTSLGVSTFDDDKFASPIKPITKLTVSQNQVHVKEGSSGVGVSDAGDDPLAEEAKINRATAGAPELCPRSFCGQLQQFEQSVTHHLDQLDARLDTLDGRLDQQTAMLAQILSLLQMQPLPPPESQGCFIGHWALDLLEGSGGPLPVSTKGSLSNAPLVDRVVGLLVHDAVPWDSGTVRSSADELLFKDRVRCEMLTYYTNRTAARRLTRRFHHGVAPCTGHGVSPWCCTLEVNIEVSPWCCT
ncbi:hypothetical protein TEA_018667 [Camellia sinensis var. sinensis]|uniref:Uncharacterized protein n=1 Tax=Camellia sinensis var. sinensis TaxID=542762 RepID=A0A4S4EFQ0_CAMSN|nr:hypothetical protein TEA_018667 [Camellia sinensis var. sinensis]